MNVLVRPPSSMIKQRDAYIVRLSFKATLGFANGLNIMIK